MTRDFNKQRRENERPYSRSSSSGRYGEERSPRPARPRLNRDMVDRAWENGARQNHADYRTRDDAKSQQPRDNRRRSQYSDQPSAQNGRNNRNPYGNQQNSYRPGERTPRSTFGSRPRSFESGMRNFNQKRYNEYENRGYPERPGQAGSHPGNRENAQHSDTRSQFRDRDQYRDSQRREFDRDARPPRRFDRDGDNRQPRSYDRDRRSLRNGPQRDTRNPRWQSRPAKQRDNFSREPQEFTQRGPERELFEGDYEHFDASNGADRLANQNEGHAGTPQQAEAETEERHVTRLPDGRVLKGPQHEQRMNAAFWTEIAQETDELVQHDKPSTPTEEVTKLSTDLPTTAPTKGKPKARTHTANTAERGRKAKAGQSTPKKPSSGPKPSQRGFKWPTPEG